MPLADRGSLCTVQVYPCFIGGARVQQTQQHLVDDTRSCPVCQETVPTTAFIGSSQEYLCRFWNAAQEGVVNISLVALCSERIPVVFVQGAILTPAVWQVNVGEIKPAQADKVCLARLEHVNGALLVVSTCSNGHIKSAERSVVSINIAAGSAHLFTDPE